MAQNAKDLLSATQAAIKRGAAICAESEDAGYKAINQSFLALEKLTLYVQEFDIEGQHYCPECGRKGVSLDTAGKTAAYISKVTNDTVRLLEFARGNADSRAETTTGMSDLVKGLTSDQLAQVLAWIDENEAAESPPVQ